MTDQQVSQASRETAHKMYWRDHGNNVYVQRRLTLDEVAALIDEDKRELVEVLQMCLRSLTDAGRGHVPSAESARITLARHRPQTEHNHVQ